MKPPSSRVLLATPALGFISWLKTEKTSSAYTSCENSCFASPKCCSGVLEAVNPDECFDPHKKPTGYTDFGDICYRAAPGFLGMGGLGAACCTADPV